MWILFVLLSTISKLCPVKLKHKDNEKNHYLSVSINSTIYDSTD